MAASGVEMCAVERDMTDACGEPNVVHRPHNGLATAQDFANAFQREHALVNPRQMDNVGRFEFG